MQEEKTPVEVIVERALTFVAGLEQRYRQGDSGYDVAQDETDILTYVLSELARVLPPPDGEAVQRFLNAFLDASTN